MLTGFKNGNFELSGFLKGSDTKLSFKGDTDSIAFEYGGKKLVSGMKVSGEEPSGQFRSEKLSLS